jgi:hypothetical protein
MRYILITTSFNLIIHPQLYTILTLPFFFFLLLLLTTLASVYTMGVLLHVLGFFMFT